MLIAIGLINLVDISICLQQFFLQRTNYYKMEEYIHIFLMYSIEKIQENGTYLSLAAENMLNNQITQYKQVAWNEGMNVKQFAANDIDFWEKALKTCMGNFMDILKELK